MTATVVAPIVQVQKAASPVSIAGGGTVTYTLTIRNNASGSGAGPAYDFAFGDTLPAELGSPALVLPLPAGVSASFAGNVLAGSIARLDPSTQVEVRYTATVDPATPLGRTIVNAANAQATSLPGPCGTGGNASAPCAAPQGDPGSATGERTGSGGVNNLAAATTAPFTTASINVAKSLVNPQACYAIGDPWNTRSASRCRSAAPGRSASATRCPPASCSTREPVDFDRRWTGDVHEHADPRGAVRADADLRLRRHRDADGGGDHLGYTATVANVIANQNGAALVNAAAALYQDPNDAARTNTVPHRPIRPCASASRTSRW